MSAYNVEQFIESTILSILNQSFQDFEIIVVNDCSKDKTIDIVLNKFKTDNRIKIINHIKNLGLYASRVTGILNSKGKFIILMDPDDMILNPYLLDILYYYYLEYNLDIIEYKIMKYKFNSQELFDPKDKNHYHYYSKNIITQPELSNLLFFVPGTQKYSGIVCKTIWNKIIRREILIKTIDYIGEDYYKDFIITADDSLLNVISLQFANNFSNINISGYMYNLRESSATHGHKSKKQLILFFSNYLFYNKKLHKYIKDFNKNINFLFYELKRTKDTLLNLIAFNESKRKEVNKLYTEILEDRNISNDFRKYLIRHLK